MYSMRASRPWTTRCGLHRHMCTYTMRHRSTHTHPPPPLSLSRGRPHASTRLIDIEYRSIVTLIDAEYRSMRARAWVDEVNAAESAHDDDADDVDDDARRPPTVDERAGQSRDACREPRCGGHGRRRGDSATERCAWGGFISCCRCRVVWRTKVALDRRFRAREG